MKPTVERAPLPPAYVVRMRPALAAQIADKAYARIPWPVSICANCGGGGKGIACGVCLGRPRETPLSLKRGDRLFLVEYNGAATGRADLVSVATEPGGPNGLDPSTLFVYRGYCQRRGEYAGAMRDDDLSAIGYRAVPTSCAILEALPMAPAPAPGRHVVGSDEANDLYPGGESISEAVRIATGFLPEDGRRR